MDASPPRDAAPKLPDALDAAFLGPLAENADLLESLVVEALRDHAYWRRNFHPHDASRIPAGARFDPAYQALVARTEHVLRRLASDMKDSVPWFSPRYIGHMASDLLIVGVVARFLGVLYNPNNVSLDAGGTMLRIEHRVGEQLARMVGYDTTPGAPIRAWGHLTSGGTVANIESLWRMRAARLLPLAVARGLRAMGLALPTDSRWGTFLRAADDWALANIGLADALDLRRAAYADAADRGGQDLVSLLHDAVEAERVEALGLHDFLRRSSLPSPVVVAPHSAHYSWTKALKLLGLGAHHLRGVDVDDHMRMAPRALRAELDALRRERIPVLAVIGVLGTTEFGTFDPIHAIVDERDARLTAGQAFGVHVDAAWGGYVASVFRAPDGGLVPHEHLRAEYRHFPTSAVYSAYAALGRTDSLTIDPHKLGFIPFPAGAFVCRDRRISALLSQAAPYVFDERTARIELDTVRDEDLGRYILEGSKPGSSAASVYAVHEVLPLHHDGFGALLKRTIAACEWLYDRMHTLAEELAPIATLILPFEPDSNVFCLAINPLHNTCPTVMNRFMRALFDRMRFRTDAPTSAHEFIGSYTSITGDRLSREVRGALVARLSLAPGSLDAPGDSLFLLRHTLMNPWLLAGSPTPLEQYVEFLRRNVEELVAEGPDAA